MQSAPSLSVPHPAIPEAHWDVLPDGDPRVTFLKAVTEGLKSDERGGGREEA